MDKLRSTFILQTVFAFFTPCLLEITSADVRSVHPGENIILPCNITNYPEISWYRLRSDEVKLLISAEEWKLKKTFSLRYNVDKTHFDATESNSSISLMIIGVRETDLGFYYCGGRNDATHTQFGKLIRLNFTDDQNHEADVSDTAGCHLYTPWSYYYNPVMCVCTFCFNEHHLLLSVQVRDIGT
ncbi:uncharacterized protein Hap1MRO34_003372 isoform 1-T1 [Clarias gariepinus]